jgi:hypothetical protein
MPTVVTGKADCRPLARRARRDKKAPGQMAAGRPSQSGGDMMVMAGTTYLLGLGELANDPGSLAWLRVGSRLVLQRRPHTAPGAGGRCQQVRVQAPDGRPLGYLPLDDARSVAEFLDAGMSVTARISALVPAFRRQRVQLAIEVGQAAGNMNLPKAGPGDLTSPLCPSRSRPAVRGDSSNACPRHETD